MHMNIIKKKRMCLQDQLAWNVDGYTEFTVAADGDAATAKFMTGKAMAGAGRVTV